MRFQDFIVEETKKQAEEAFRYAKNTPADKVNWKPLDTGRSVLDQAREMAKSPDWGISVLKEGSADDWSEEQMAKEKAEMETWTTVDQCYSECMKRLDKLAEVYKAIPDEQLSKTKFLPYGGGRDFTWMEMMDYPRWNFNWHAGQIAYVQTLYGDKEMY